MREILKAYLAAALWTSTDESDPSGGEPLDRNYSASDFAAEDLAIARQALASFLAQAGDLTDGIGDDALGHDFWLTRNGHGTGFWDRGLGEQGDKLAALAESFGECGVYIGDAGALHFSP